MTPKITKRQYVEYLLATPVNYTGSNLAAHLDPRVSHDAVSDFLRREHVTARHLWELARSHIHDTEDAYLILDDSVQDKRYSRKIEVAQRQWSGAEGGIVRGIGVVNLLHTSAPEAGAPEAGGEFCPIDFRIFAPEHDGKTKHEHAREMLQRAFYDKAIQARTVLFDAWYAAADTLKLLHRAKRVFVTTLRSNRVVSLSKEAGYVSLDEIEWTDERMRMGVSVKLKRVPFRVQLFKVVASDGDIEWLITNRPALDAELGRELSSTRTTQGVQEENAVRWRVEQFHRELKQLTGSAKCQSRKQRAQRNHIACCYHAWLSLKVSAARMAQTRYAAKAGLLAEYLRAELHAPRIPAIQTV
jgi:hypothetical protein